MPLVNGTLPSPIKKITIFVHPGKKWSSYLIKTIWQALIVKTCDSILILIPSFLEIMHLSYGV